MRVCFVSSHALGFDGWGRYTTEVVKGAHALGIEPVLVTSTPTVDSALVGVECHPILPPLFGRRLGTLRSLSHAPHLRQIISTCDVVHCTVELYAPLVALARPRHVPYVQNAHGTWAVRPLLHPAQRMLFRPAFRRADRLLVLSRFTRDWMARLIALPRHEVLSGGVHPADFERVVAVSLPAWMEREPVALTVGAVKARKGHHVALEAVSLARRQFPALHFVAIGSVADSSGYADQLHGRAAELGMMGYFHLLGQAPFDELVAWYQRSRVFMLLAANQGSTFEGLGLVYLEAQAAGTPAIGTRGCGAEDAVVDGKTGFLVPQNDPQAAAEALVRLLRDDDLHARMGRAAREHARRLSWENLTRRVVEIYGELLAAGQAMQRETTT